MYFEHGGVPFVMTDVGDEAFIRDLARFCLSVEPEILRRPVTWQTDSESSPTSSRYGSYNFLMFPSPLVKRVYDLLRATYLEFAHAQRRAPESLWVQSWVNIHRGPQQHLKVHRHLGFRAHGYLAVDTAGSTTVYEIGDDDVVFENADGRMTLVGQDDVWHRVTPRDSEAPRISIAFDLLANDDIERGGDRVFIPLI
jgi:hypothetical protein